MARDETARERDKETSLLNRRKYLKFAGAAVAATAASGTGSAAASDYRTITVSAGNNRTFNLGSGDTLENTLIDITADGASFQVNASGDGWTVRNVGVKGMHSGDHTGAFWVRGNGTIENVYIGDGDRGKDDGAEVTGVFVDRNHSGEITIDRINTSNFSDNGVYGSAPGNPPSHHHPGGGGTVKITNSFSERCGSSGFRIGTDGSYVRNCVAVNGYDRGFWGYYNETSFENCDAADNRIQFCAGNTGMKAEKNAVMNITNCRSQGTWTGNQCVGTINGEAGSSPRRKPPEGVPTSAEEAASGTTSSDSGSSTASGKLLELVSGSNTSNVTYEFTVDGSVTKRTSGSDPVAEDNDSITDNGDGTKTATGEAGSGYGDAYYVDGEVTSMNLDESKWTIRYDGDEVSVADVSASNEGSPTVDRFDVSRSEKLGTDRMFSVQWSVSDDGVDLDTVEVTVVESASDVNFSVTDVSGASASGWDLFQFPGGSTLDVNVRVKNASGNAVKESKNITL